MIRVIPSRKLTVTCACADDETPKASICIACVYSSQRNFFSGVSFCFSKYAATIAFRCARCGRARGGGEREGRGERAAGVGERVECREGCAAGAGARRGASARRRERAGSRRRERAPARTESTEQQTAAQRWLERVEACSRERKKKPTTGLGSLSSPEQRSICSSTSAADLKRNSSTESVAVSCESSSRALSSQPETSALSPPTSSSSSASASPAPMCL